MSSAASLAPLCLFAFVSSITPGPNNLMLTASGIRFGLRRTLPHALGVSFGLGVLLVLCASGVGALLMSVPGMQPVLKALSAAYLVWIAWQMRNMGAPKAATAHAEPMSFFGAGLFQFINPKCWMMCIMAASSLMPPLQPYWAAAALLCLLMCAINFPCILGWAAGGALFGRLLARENVRRAFCAVMMLLTLYTAVAVYL
jgi:threonine/homoserine/homoserine lactone efflux protein